MLYEKNPLKKCKPINGFKANLTKLFLASCSTAELVSASFCNTNVKLF